MHFGNSKDNQVFATMSSNIPFPHSCLSLCVCMFPHSEKNNTNSSRLLRESYKIICRELLALIFINSIYNTNSFIRLFLNQTSSTKPDFNNQPKWPRTPSFVGNFFWSVKIHMNWTERTIYFCFTIYTHTNKFHIAWKNCNIEGIWVLLKRKR